MNIQRLWEFQIQLPLSTENNPPTLLQELPIASLSVKSVSLPSSYISDASRGKHSLKLTDYTGFSQEEVGQF